MIVVFAAALYLVLRPRTDLVQAATSPTGMGAAVGVTTGTAKKGDIGVLWLLKIPYLLCRLMFRDSWILSATPRGLPMERNATLSPPGSGCRLPTRGPRRGRRWSLRPRLPILRLIAFRPTGHEDQAPPRLIAEHVAVEPTAGEFPGELRRRRAPV
jgi:hypothetical protein